MAKSRKARDLSEAVREGVQSLLKQKITSASNVADEVERVAIAIGKKPATLRSLLYEGKGGFDLMVAALIVAYDLNENTLDRFLEDLKGYLRKISPVSQSDKNWSELDALLSETEKVHWTEVMKAVNKIELTLANKSDIKKRSSNK